MQHIDDSHYHIVDQNKADKNAHVVQLHLYKAQI